MERIRIPVATAGLLALTLLSFGPAAAQSESPATAGSEASAPSADVLQVTAVEYAFEGLPTSVPAGTSVGMTNGGAEVHELVIVRVADDVTQSLEELMAMEGDPMELGLVEQVGEMPLFAAPGATAEGSLTLEREGRYVAICFIPQGLTDMSLLANLGPDADPSAMPAELQAIMGNPPHAALGMVQEFTVTAADSTPGPLPAAAPADAPASAAPTAAAY
jgi:plastocyanin